MSGEAVADRRRQQLQGAWEVAVSAPDAFPDLDRLSGVAWYPAIVPGTAAAAVPDSDLDPDAFDWWWRTTFREERAAPGEEVVLGLDGLATVAEVFLNGELILRSDSMFDAHVIDVGDRLLGDNELAICCRALGPRLRERRRPRARWRTRVAEPANLRFYRTMLMGRAPGFAPGPVVVGPWRPVWLERRRGVVIDGVRLRARLDGEAGVLSVTGTLRSLDARDPPAAVGVTVGAETCELAAEPVAPGVARIGGRAIVPGAELWWPHTHGQPTLHDVTVAHAGGALWRARVGFRELRAAAELAAEGPALRINGVPVFARGAVWTPTSPGAPAADETQLREVLGRVVAAGMNMLRIPGTAAYESSLFYDLCDELGILVWQDFMLANFDYPDRDPTFMEVIEREARAVLAELGPRPSLAVLCGGSEVAQQVAMMGLDPALAEGPLYGELLPAVVVEAEVQAPYLPSSPWGGSLPFRNDRGVAHYFGVGAYGRPLEDARRAEVRFASEALAFANVPDDEALEEVLASGVQGAAWKRGVPRDAGAGWDFDDVRDHYLRELFCLDPAAVRASDPARYLELSRQVSGEVMSEVFAEWRREASPCRGGLVLWLRDLQPGAGWGVLDHRGMPKVALRHLARVLAPVAVWTTDEGLGGIGVHVANDGPDPLFARLRVALYRGFEIAVEESELAVALEPHEAFSTDVETVLGHFADVSWAYRFGPPGQDLVAVSLHAADSGRLISQAFRFPVGRPADRLGLERLGLAGRLSVADDGARRLTLGSRAFAYGVRVQVEGHELSDDAFGVEPGHERTIELAPLRPDEPPPALATVTALNLDGASLRVTAG